jgi:hypothetical protein
MAIMSLYGSITASFCKEVVIHKSEYGIAIFEFFRMIIVDMLPLRLHDVEFLSIVNEKLFDNDQSLYRHIGSNQTTSTTNNTKAQPPLKYLNAREN